MLDICSLSGPFADSHSCCGTVTTLAVASPADSCSSFHPISVIKPCPKTTWRGKGLFGIHVLITAGHSEKSGSELKQEQKQKARSKSASWFSLRLVFNYLSCMFWVHLPRNGTDSGLGPPTSINNPENTTRICLLAIRIEAFSQFCSLSPSDSSLYQLDRNQPAQQRFTSFSYLQLPRHFSLLQ